MLPRPLCSGGGKAGGFIRVAISFLEPDQVRNGTLESEEEQQPARHAHSPVEEQPKQEDRCALLHRLRSLESRHLARWCCYCRAPPTPPFCMCFPLSLLAIPPCLCPLLCRRGVGRALVKLGLLAAGAAAVVVVAGKVRNKEGAVVTLRKK